MAKYCINNLKLSNNDIYLIIMLLVVVCYLFYNAYINSEMFSSISNKTPGVVLDYEGNGNYIIDHTNKNTSRRELIKGDIMYESTIKSINNKTNIITILPPPSTSSIPSKFDTRVDPTSIPGKVIKYRGNGIYDIDQTNGSKTRRPVIKGDIMHGNTITNINEREVTLTTIPGTVLDYDENGNYIIEQPNGHIIKRDLIVNDIMYGTTIIAISKERTDIILNKNKIPGKKSTPGKESTPGKVTKYEGNGNYSITHTDESVTSRPLIIGDSIYTHTITSIINNRIKLTNNKI